MALQPHHGNFIQKTLSKHRIFTYLASMNFIHQHLLQRFYIHLPSLHEFYLPALASKILYSLTWCLWILSTGTCPKILYSLKYPSPSTTNFIPKKSFHFPGGPRPWNLRTWKTGFVLAGVFSWPCARKYYPSRTFIQSPNFGIFKVQGFCPMEKYSATLGLQPKNTVWNFSEQSLLETAKG